MPDYSNKEKLDRVIYAGIKTKARELAGSSDLEDIEQIHEDIDAALNFLRSEPEQEQKKEKGIDQLFSDSKNNGNNGCDTINLVRKAVKQAFRDCPDINFTVAELIEEARALNGNELDEVPESTIQTYIYKTLKELKNEGHLQKPAYGEYTYNENYMDELLQEA